MPLTTVEPNKVALLFKGHLIKAMFRFLNLLIFIINSKNIVPKYKCIKGMLPWCKCHFNNGHFNYIKGSAATIDLDKSALMHSLLKYNFHLNFCEASSESLRNTIYLSLG